MNPSLILIAAVAKNGVIGRAGALPWHLPEDLRHFKELTTGHTVVMGRKTWESLPARFRPLPGRRNIVVSRNPGFAAPGATLVDSLEAALKVGAGATVFLIGGAELYAHALPLAGRLELTEIDAEFAGDAFFPPIDPAFWHETARSQRHSAAGLDFAFVSYVRTAAP